MNTFIRIMITLIVLVLFGYWANYYRAKPSGPTEGASIIGGVTYLGQGWSEQTRDFMSHTSFGSRILPYDWFLALELPSGPLRDENVFTALGFIPSIKSTLNPDSLPVGFAKDIDEHGQAYIGLTCTACHTSELLIKGERVRIDGGQAHIDYTAFEQTILSALEHTRYIDDAQQRFLEKVSSSVVDHPQLLAELDKKIAELKLRYRINSTDVAYGAGRLDAFGQIFNAVTAIALKQPENARSPNAPTSYPVLWDASHTDLVQWNGSAPNMEPGPLLQNATTALAVYGTVEINALSAGFHSSIAVNNLGLFQKGWYQLVSPQYPTHLLGDIDMKAADRGKGIYLEHCMACHSLVKRTDQTRQLRTHLTPLEEIQTDSLMAERFIEGTIFSGALAGRKQWVIIGDKLPLETTRLNAVMHVAASTLVEHPWLSLKALLQEFKWNHLPPKVKQPAYKARSLNGIWASAPYLHNGSVPSLWDLLQSPELRPQQFYLGAAEFDVEKVGINISSLRGFLFDTRLPGNANHGHNYGTKISEHDKRDLLEYLKSL